MQKLVFLVMVWSLTFSTAQAAVTDAEFADLKAGLVSVLKRIEALEAENSKLRLASEQLREQNISISKAAQSGNKSSWTDTMAIKGDFRYRYETIDVENKDIRERNRLRARAKLTANPSDNLEIGVGVASGGDDPRSTNQTLSAAGATKDLRLDLAYFKWSATPNLDLIGGKYKNIYYRPEKTGLIWDGDYNPEGVALVYNNENYFLQGSIQFLESDSKKSNNRTGFGLQGGFHTHLGDSQLTAGMGYFEFGAKDRTIFYGDDDDFLGNSYTCIAPSNLASCVYDNDYEQVELFAHLSTHAGDLPLSLFFDYVNNMAADDFDTGWNVGVKVGKAKASRTWELAYIYEDLEADATLGLLSDSNFGGGGTDVKGHIFKGGWAISKKWKIGFTYLVNESNGNKGTEKDYNRLQVDTAFKF